MVPRSSTHAPSCRNLPLKAAQGSPPSAVAHQLPPEVELGTSGRLCEPRTSGKQARIGSGLQRKSSSPLSLPSDAKCLEKRQPSSSFLTASPGVRCQLPPPEPSPTFPPLLGQRLDEEPGSRLESWLLAPVTRSHSHVLGCPLARPPLVPTPALRRLDLETAII